MTFGLYDYVIVENFFTQSDFESILLHLPSSTEYVKDGGYYSHKRTKVKLGSEHPITRLIQDNVDRVNQLIGEKTKHYGEVEVRKYNKGDFIDWHRDYDHLNVNAKPNYFECVLTCTNTSDSKTEFKDECTGEINSVTTEPNQFVILCIQGVKHRVTPVTTGERIIIKFKLKKI